MNQLEQSSATVTGAPPQAGSEESLAHALQEVMQVAKSARGPRLEIDPQDVRRGLGRLVLTLVKLLHEILERQAIRRIEGGALTDKQVEDMGWTLMRQAEEIERMSAEFGLKTEELNLDLGPLGRLM